MKGLAPSAATRADLSGSSRGSPADALGDLRVTVRVSPPGTPPRTSYSSRSEHPVRFPGDFAGLSHGAPSISFCAPSVDRMSIAASGDGFTSSEDEGAVGLPPSGVVATAAPDPELTAMLARAAVSIGLEVNRPPSPEPSRLDDWFLGAGRGSQPRPAPVPFFPEVHEELASSWMAPFTARSRLSASSVLTTLDGGVARGYAGIPQVERAVAVHLCPRNAATWRNRPRLPSKACKLTAALAAKVYSAAGQAASALHAMAILQVHQAKALKQVHEGSTDPGLMQELRTATDFALRATKVTARSLGKAMSTMVVQERHLWLNLAEMKDVDKARFLDAPISQGGLFGDTAEGFAQQFSAVQQQTEAIQHILPRRDAPSTAAPGARPQSARRRGRPPASSRAAPPQAESTHRPARRASRRRAAPPASQPGPKSSRKSTKRPWRGQPGDVGVCSFSGDGENSAAPSPGGGPGGESSVSFCFCSAAGPRASGTHLLKERAISFSSGFSGPWDDSVRRPASSLSPTTHFASSQESTVRGRHSSPRTSGQSRSGPREFGEDASERTAFCAIHPYSLSLHHHRYVDCAVGAACTASGGVAHAVQPVSLAHAHNSTRLRDSVRQATSQVQRHSRDVGGSPERPCLARGDCYPPGKGCNRAGPSSRDEAGVLQPLLHRTQERWWPSANPGSASLEPGFTQAPVQDADAQAHDQMHSAPGLVCSDRPEGRLLSRFDPSATQTVSTVCVRRSGMAVQGPPLRALPVSPCVHEGCRGRPYPVTGSGRQDPQLPRRLAYSSPIQRAVGRSQGLGAPAPQPVGASGQLGKEQALPCAENLFSRCGVRLGEYDGTPHGGTCPSSAELPEFLQRQKCGTTETVSEAPGAYGIRSCSHAARIASYETTSALATLPGPEVGMAPRYTASRYLPAVSPLPQPLDRPCLSTGRGAPRTSVPAYCCHDRCLQHGLGRYMQRAGSLGALDRAPTALAHQLPGAVGSAFSLAAVPATAVGQARASPHGQHCGGLVYMRHHMAPASRSMEPPCVAPGRDAADLSGLPPAVVETIIQARAPSTRQTYARKWSLFATWCSSRREDPRRCTIGVVLSFLQERLERRLSPSTLKVYVAAIAAHHDAVDGRSLGKHDLIVRFLKGARRMNPSRPPLVPSWDLSILLSGLQRGPFEPLDSVELKFLSLKTALLTALTSIKRVGDLQAFSVSEECLVFGPVYSHVVLRPRPGYVPKVPTTPFCDQVVNLQALPSEEADPALALLCPVRALRIYVTRTRSVRSSEQLFVCHGGQQKGKAVSKQRLAHWIVEAVALAYQSQGEPCPLGVRAHSTRSVASSHALAHGASLADICRAAGWATPNTFARFYNLRVEPVSSRVLGK